MIIFLSVCLLCYLALGVYDFIHRNDNNELKHGAIYVGVIKGETTRVYVHALTEGNGVKFSYANSTYWGYSWMFVKEFLDTFTLESCVVE